MNIRHKLRRTVLLSHIPMRLNYVLAPLTIVLLVVTIVNIKSHLDKRQVEETETTTDAANVPEADAPDARNPSIISESSSLLIAGVSSKVPTKEDYVLLDSVPWDLRDVNRLFRSAGVERSCQLLESGVDVVQPLGRAAKGQASPLGRRSAFGIRLQVGKELGNGLPGISRGYIEDYLKNHQLMIQTSFYQDTDGKLILSPDLRAALYEIDGPYLTSLQEEMIKTSVADLRNIGAYWKSDEEFRPSACRTHIFAFHYERDSDKGTAQPVTQREYELVFLHMLPEATAENPKLAVFATSDGRTQFHLLEEMDPDQPEQLANVNADIRFADVQLLGMLPRLPVVTRVKHRAILSVPIDMVKAQVEGLPGKPPEHGLSTILDEFYARAVGKDVKTEGSEGEASKADGDAAKEGSKDDGAQDEKTKKDAAKAEPVKGSNNAVLNPSEQQKPAGSTPSRKKKSGKPSV